jgi:hypothetical protein
MSALGDFAAAKSFVDEATSTAAGDEEALRAIRYAAATVASITMNSTAVVELLADKTLPDDPVMRHRMLLLLAGAVVSSGGRPALERGLDLVRQAEAIGGSGLDGTRTVDLSADPIARFQRAKMRAFVFAFSGEAAGAAVASEECALLARAAGLRFEECALLHNAAEQYCLLGIGDRERARSLVLESSALGRDIGADRVERHNEMLFAYVDRDAHRLAEIAAATTSAGEPWLDLYAHYWLGHLLAETLAPSARPALEHALGIARKLGIRSMADRCASALAFLGDAPRSGSSS